MKNFIYNLLGQNGSISMMRVMSLICLIIAGYIAIYGLNTHADLNGLAMLCGVFLGAAFGGKTAQKVIETRNAVISEASQETPK